MVQSFCANKGVVYLDKETNASPRQSRVNGVILDGKVSDLLELNDPCNDLLQLIMYDDLLVAFLVLPSNPRALSICALSSYNHGEGMIVSTNIETFNRKKEIIYKT
jgi:hypothetical protein